MIAARAPEQDEPALAAAAAVRDGRFAAEKAGEVHDAVEIAADVGQPEKPGLRQRDGGHAAAPRSLRRHPRVG